MSDQDYRKFIKKLISEKSGHEISEISNDSYIQEDLNIGEMELADILTEIEEEFQIELLDKKSDIETVENLVDMVAEQVE